MRQWTLVVGNTWVKYVGLFNLSLLLTGSFFPSCLSRVLLWFLFPFYVLASLLYFYLPVLILSFISQISLSPFCRPAFPFPSQCRTFLTVKAQYHLLNPPPSPVFDMSQVWVCVITPTVRNFLGANKVPSGRPSWSDPMFHLHGNKQTGPLQPWQAIGSSAFQLPMFRFESASPLSDSLSPCKDHLTNSMEEGPSWTLASGPGAYENSRPLCSPRVHVRVHKCLLLVTLLSQMNSVNIALYYLCSVHFNIIIQFIPMYSK